MDSTTQCSKDNTLLCTDILILCFMHTSIIQTTYIHDHVFHQQKYSQETVTNWSSFYCQRFYSITTISIHYTTHWADFPVNNYCQRYVECSDATIWNSLYHDITIQWKLYHDIHDVIKSWMYSLNNYSSKFATNLFKKQ